MTTPVKFELAKLLKEKEFSYAGKSYYENEIWLTDTLARFPRGTLKMDVCFPAPTIAEVVMWLYKKHDIWIEVRKTNFFKEIRFQSYMNENPLVGNLGGYISHSQPTEAYEAAIEYCLTNLI